MTYPETVEYLYSLRWHGTKLGLQHTFELARLMGDPQNQLRFIHVAGTNGKGSTCAMLESIYRSAGLRVGLFTSPHLVAFGERIQVNREPIPDAEVVRLVEEMRPALARFPADGHPTFFEVVTVVALRYFLEQRCDLVVWETGLGGRLDATNIVTPLASVVTNIQQDHEKWLGSTLRQIAYEKAGIIKAGVPVVTGAQGSEAMEIIAAKAREAGAALVVVEPGAERELGELDLPLLGQHQRRNAAVAMAVVKVLQAQIPVGRETVLQGLKQVYWPGRMQLVRRASGQQVILDGAHNPAGVESFVETVRSEFGERKVVLIVGMLADKDWGKMCADLVGVAAQVLVVPVANERSADPDALASAFRRGDVQVRVCGGLVEAFELAKSAELVAVVGSLYLVGEALEFLGVLRRRDAREKALNEWGLPKAGPAGRSGL